ncbi:MAG: hypothetical protein NT154_39640, partial [Verrucomicrobia bacterium]|nr:hypothetical protein [Verrucomicrobiota bacterium]
NTTYTLSFYEYDWVSHLFGPSITTNATTLAGPPNWTPAQLGANLTLWLDASSTNSIVLNGNQVRQWIDLSGKGNTVTNANGLTQPLYQTSGLNDRPTVNFTTVGMGLWSAGNVGVSGSAPRALAAVMNCGMIGTGTPAGNEGFGFDVIPGANAWVPYFSGSGDIAENNPSWSTNNNVLFGQYYNSTCSGYANGSFLGSNGVAPNTLPGPIQLGSRSDGQARVGKLSEVVYVSTGLAAPQQHQLEGYFAWKWGLQTNLPSDHAYIHNAPVLVPGPALQATWVPGSGVQLGFNTVPGYQFILQFTTNLARPIIWVPVVTNTASKWTGNWTSTFTNDLRQPSRFYRAVLNLQ